MEKIAVIGAGLIGRSWAIVFARAGREVALHDSDAASLEANLAALKIELNEEVLSRINELFPGPGGTAPEAYAW